jgi:type I restriction enzyme M protein
MIDASAGFIKDGNKNRLREQDIHKIVDTFTRQADMPRYAAWSLAEIDAKNDFNLNLPRYIDSQSPRTCRTSTATCAAASRPPTWTRKAMAPTGTVCPGVRASLFNG